MSERTETLPIACAVYEHDWSDYPDKVRVSMKDGQVIDYRREITQPAPIFKAMLDKFTETCVGGYKYKTKGLGKRTGRRL